MAPTLDIMMYPHILDRMLDFSSVQTLTQLARTCTTIRKRIYDCYLPVRHLQLQGYSREIVGVYKNNTAMHIDERIVRAHAFAVEIVDILNGVGILDEVAILWESLAPLLFNLRIVRILPVVSVERLIHSFRPRSTVGRHPLRYRTVTLPLPFRFEPDKDTGRVSWCVKHFIEWAFYALPELGEEPVAVLMSENPGCSHDRRVQDLYYEEVMANLLGLFEDRQHPLLPFKLVFVNIETWLSFRFAARTLDELHTAFLDDLCSRLNLRLSWSQWLTFRQSFSFLTLEEYKAEVGAANFEPQRHVKPTKRLPFYLQWTSEAPEPSVDPA